MLIYNARCRQRKKTESLPQPSIRNSGTKNEGLASGQVGRSIAGTRRVKITQKGCVCDENGDNKGLPVSNGAPRLSGNRHGRDPNNQ